MDDALATKKVSPIRPLNLSLPLIAAGVASIFLINAGAAGQKLGALMTAYLISPFGMALILAAPTLGINVFVAALSLIFVDALLSAFIILNFDIITRVPVIGRLVLKMEKGAHAELRRYPWLRRFIYIGIVLFITIPMLGTGVIMGTLIGKLLGLKPLPLWIAVVIGAVISSAPFVAASFGLIFLGNYVHVSSIVAVFGR